MDRVTHAKGCEIVRHFVFILSAGAVFLLSCGLPASEWPHFEQIEVRETPPGTRRLILPSSYEAFLRGQLAYNDEQNESAARYFRAALRTDPNSSYLHVWLARSELAQREITSARHSIDRALALDKCSEFALSVAAEILVEDGNTESATEKRRVSAAQPTAKSHKTKRLDNESDPEFGCLSTSRNGNVLCELPFGSRNPCIDNTHSTR